MNSKSEDTSNKIALAQDIVEVIIRKHTKPNQTIDSFYVGGVNKLEEACQEIAIELHNIYED